jgi:IMP and pyridine-specific 5'-nucleotidase
MALRTTQPPSDHTEPDNIQPSPIDGPFNGPSLISFDGDQTLYSDGQNFEKNPKLAFYLYQLLRHGVNVAVVTAAGYEYQVEKYEYRLSGLLQYFKARGLTQEECNRFYLFGGECNFLLQLSGDFRLHPVKECGQRVEF